MFLKHNIMPCMENWHWILLSCHEAQAAQLGCIDDNIFTLRKERNFTTVRHGQVQYCGMTDEVDETEIPTLLASEMAQPDRPLIGTIPKTRGMPWWSDNGLPATICGA